jgi:hypothetical protein
MVRRPRRTVRGAATRHLGSDGCDMEPRRNTREHWQDNATSTGLTKQLRFTINQLRLCRGNAPFWHPVIGLGGYLPRSSVILRRLRLLAVKLD